MKLAIVGLGRVGAVGAAWLANSGHEVLGIDINAGTLAALRSATADFFEPGLNELVKTGMESGNLRVAHADEIETLDVAATIVAVPTPPAEGGAADLDAVHKALAWIKQRSSPDALVLMKSTLPPGTGRMLAEQYGIRYVANPEFQQEGRALEDWYHPSRIVLGVNEREDIYPVQQMYAHIDAPWVVTDTTTAEMTKYASNAFLATKISFINEIANLCDLTGANIDSVATGMGLDPRIGPAYLRAGIGYGGSCFPKDIEALKTLSQSNGYALELLKGVIKINDQQRKLVIDVLKRQLGDLAGRQVTLLGLAFKPNTDDVRESPAIEIAQMLVGEGANVTAYDPVAMERARAQIPDDVRTVPTAADAILGAEAVVICTEWDEFQHLDWEALRSTMRHPFLLLDGRNTLSPHAMESFGYDYVGIGRGNRAPSMDELIPG